MEMLTLIHNWEGSVLQNVPMNRISVFSCVPGEEENITFLLWSEHENSEPKIIRYAGHTEHVFPDFDAFLEWSIGEFSA